MIVRRFLLWARTANAGARAEAVSALARAYLYSDLGEGDRADAEAAMTAMLDDPSPLVRQAMAEAFANAAEAPYQLVIPLAHDQPEIAALVLSRSPVLTDADLVDCAAFGGELAQIAVAMRPVLSPAVAAAIAEIGEALPLTVLACNAGAAIAPATLARMVERHGEDGGLREALLERQDLPLAVRLAIAERLSTSLSDFARACGWIGGERADRIAREAQERTIVSLAVLARADELPGLVAALREKGQTTPMLVLRALLSSADGFVAAVLADLAGLPAPRVVALMRSRGAAPGAALYRRTGLPERLEPLFLATFAALRDEGRADRAGIAGRLSRPVIARAIAACRSLETGEGARMTALLRRFEAEAAREESRVLVDSLADEAALAAVLAHAPQALFEEPPLLSAA